jgi:hypothetical protein
VAVRQIDDLRVFQRERQKHVRPCNNVHRRYVATHSNADAARQAGAAEHQVVLGRLARRTTDSDGLSSLVIPQRNPLPGDESVQRAPLDNQVVLRCLHPLQRLFLNQPAVAASSFCRRA